VVGSGAGAFNETYATACVAGCGCYDFLKLSKRHVVGAGARDEGTAGAEHLEGAQVELFVAAHGAFGGPAGFGKGRWVEHDGVVFGTIG
jgi:hypothetical protein